MSINLDYINGYLEAMSCLNAGPNHGCNFNMQLLADNHSWYKALEHYYASIANGKGCTYEAALWHITTTQINRETFIRAIERWFLQLIYSPKPHHDNGILCVNGFIDALLPVTLNHCDLYQISTIPPLSYDMDWDDFVILHNNQRYLLHFGVSD